MALPALPGTAPLSVVGGIKPPSNTAPVVTIWHIAHQFDLRHPGPIVACLFNLEME